MSTDFATVPGVVLDDEVIEPRGFHAGEVRRGEVYRIVDLEGSQVADFVCFNLARPEEKLSPQNTVVLNGRIYPGVGYTLFSDEAGKLMTITADTCGTHDMIAGACSRFTNAYRYRVEDTPNCRDNFARALEPWGIGWKQIPYNMNVFMNCPVTPRAASRSNCRPRARATISTSPPTWTSWSPCPTAPRNATSATPST